MSFGVMAQGLKMSRTNNALRDSFLIKYASLVKIHVYAESIGDHTAQDLKLDLTHKANSDIVSFGLVS